jgi:hypothetical protein
VHSADLLPLDLTPPSPAQLRRLREYYRGAGWPRHDNLELDLLALGLIERAGPQRERIVVTDAGIRTLARRLDHNRHALDDHDALVARVARELRAQRRLVFTGLSLRVRVEERWAVARPDLYSLRDVAFSEHLHPVIHEVKVRREDLLGDLRNAGKRAGYQALSAAFYYVIAEGIAEPAEVPPDCGLIIATRTALVPARRSQLRAVQPGAVQWLSIARRAALPADPDDDPQLRLQAIASAGTADPSQGT